MLITGFLRSGTSLLEKYLHNHPQLVIASQPFPFLYYRLKEAFYAELGRKAPRYPLGHLFGERLYRRAQFLDFVTRFQMTSEQVDEVMRSMKGYSGQLTPELIEVARPSGTLVDIFRGFASHYPNLLHKTEAQFGGSKEVFCEEYIPYFLDMEVPCVLIIRDPRAVVASIHCGKGESYANASLTVLYILRGWRKSVAYAIQHAEHPRFHWIGFEQLTTSPISALQALVKDIGLTPFPEEVFDKPLRAQDGSEWQGNSSFGRPESNGPRYRQFLDAETIAFIEAVCGPEMDWLGLSRQAQLPAGTIETFSDPFQPGRPALSEEDRKMELERLELIAHAGELSSDEAEREAWFIFPSVETELRKAWRTEGSMNG
ncbi:MAG: sulfotransferase family protein [Hyphomicrobiales bacterium]|nr:MAG: sulfotransferase family protein [Hyphomicrobiales bacterium]